MDGSNRRVLVQNDLGLPNGLTYDFQSSLLCWADAGTACFQRTTPLWDEVGLLICLMRDAVPAGTHKMECMHPDRGDRLTVLEGIQYPFGITSYGRKIFYTDWNRSPSFWLFFNLNWMKTASINWFLQIWELMWVFGVYSEFLWSKNNVGLFLDSPQTDRKSPKTLILSRSSPCYYGMGTRPKARGTFCGKIWFFSYFCTIWENKFLYEWSIWNFTHMPPS